MASIDLNSHFDDAILDLATSVAIACGLHAGDSSTIRHACQAAADKDVTIGAQVAYPDMSSAGRRASDIEARALRDAVLYQLGALDGFAQVAGTGVKYVKPRGALADACLVDSAHAEAVVAAAHEYDPAIAVLGPPGSPMLAIADTLGMEIVPEAYVDRAYAPDGRLVPRHTMGPSVYDRDHAAGHAVAIATEHRLTAVDGSVIEIRARSICIPNGTREAIEFGRAVRDGLEAAAVRVHAFAV